MPLDDDDPDKWVLKEHTKVKHRLLRKYLVPWTRILSSQNPRIHYFDGFAGRGAYEEGEPGSPLLAMDVADRHSDLYDEFLCTFVEKNESNFNDLATTVDEKEEFCSDKIKVHKHQNAFADVSREIIDGIDDGNEIIPSFFFIDPFGYKAVPFEMISEIINLRSTGVEVFLTFMVRDIRRFLSSNGHEDSITSILGTDEWKDLREDQGVDNLEEEILKIYEKRLKEVAGAKYVWPFEMKLPEKRETVYYLVHVTNHFKGFKTMKDVMFNEGAEDQFAYLGPDHYAYDSEQQTLFDMTGGEDERVNDLKEYLDKELHGERMTFLEVMERTYQNTDLITKHYRKAIKKLADENRAQIFNHPEEKKGTHTGLGEDDKVEFDSKSESLDSFL